MLVYLRDGSADSIPLRGPTAWSPDQQRAAMFAPVSRRSSCRTEGRGLGFGQVVRTQTEGSLKDRSVLLSWS